MVACEDQGPTPQLDQIARTLVCNVPGGTFDLHGAHLDKAHVELQRVATPVEVAVSDPVSQPTFKRDGDTLHVSVDGLQNGIFDVTAVAGPERWNVPRSLAVLQRPMVSAIAPTGLCDSQQKQSLTIHGDGFYVVRGLVPSVSIQDSQHLERLNVMGTPSECVDAITSVVSGVQLCNALSVEIPEGALEPGVFTAVISNPPPLGCASLEMMPFTVEPAPIIAAAQTTAALCQGGGNLDIKGTGFLPGATVALGGVTPSTSTMVSDTEITASFIYSPLFVSGQQLSLVVTNPDGCRATAVQAVTIQSGPVLLAVDPPITYKPLRTGLVLYLSTLNASGIAATLTPHAGGSPVTLTVTGDPDHASRAIAEVPPNLATGVYDLALHDGSNCDAHLASALTITDNLTLNLSSVHPSFGDRSQPQRITITGSGIVAGARAYLAPHDGSRVVGITAQLENGSLFAVVPPNITATTYDIVVINPDGSVGMLNDPDTRFHSYQAVEGVVPVIARVSPLALESGCSNCKITLDGSNFGTTPTVEADCLGTVLPQVGASTPTKIVIDGTALAARPQGTECTLRVIDNDASRGAIGEAADPLVIAGGLASGKSGDSHWTALTPLGTPRRAPSVIAMTAAPGAHFLYAIGGDGGTLGSARSDGEFAAISGNTVGTWRSLPRSPLGQPTTLAGIAAAGRFVFLVGGFNGASPTTRVSRGEVLDPADAPRISDLGVSFDLNSSGIGSGTWYYRVAAQFDVSDALDPGGESLASPPVAVKLASLPQGLDVQISWTPGNTAGRAVTGWRVYRGQAPDQLDHYVDLPPASGSFVDDGTQFNASQVPQVLGAIGRFTQVGIPQLNTARAGAGVTISTDATLGRYFLYAGFGWSGGATLPTSYEVLQIENNGTGFTGNFNQASFGASGRWLIGAWAATPERDSKLSSRVIYFGQGTSNLTLTSVSSGDNIAVVDAGTIGPSGALTPLAGTQPFADVEYGYASFSGGDALFMIGGADVNAAPIVTGWTAPFGSSTPTPDAWAASIPIFPAAGRFLPAAAADGAHLFVVGGSASSFFNASTEVDVGLY